MRNRFWYCSIAFGALAGFVSASGAAEMSARSAFQVNDVVMISDEQVLPTSCAEDCADGCAEEADCGCPEECADACGDDCCDAVGCCDSCSTDCGCLSGCGGFSLKDALGMQCCAWEIGGWTQLGYTNNNIPLSQSYNDLLSFNDVPDKLHLNQQWLYLGKVADGSGGLDWGARADVVYGTDAQKTQAFGNPGAGVRGFGTWDASLDHGEYGWAIPQMYGELAYNDMSVKIGHFFTPIGYEVIPATGNFFYSHSYTMFNSEPFTHTGALATYTGIEDVTLYGGWTSGWDTGFDQLNSGSNFLGGVGLQLTDDIAVTYLNTWGNFGWRDGGSKNSYSHSVVATVAVTEKLNYIMQSDYIDTDNTGVSEFDTIGINQYLIYQMTDKVGVGGRAEWWKADGVSFNAITGGVNFKATDQLVFRPEIRHDWAPGIGLEESTFGIDAILTY